MGAVHAVAVRTVLAGVASATEALEVGSVLARCAVAETTSWGEAISAGVAGVPLLAAGAVPSASSAATGPVVEVVAVGAAVTAWACRVQWTVRA